MQQCAAVLIESDASTHILLSRNLLGMHILAPATAAVHTGRITTQDVFSGRSSHRTLTATHADTANDLEQRRSALCWYVLRVPVLIGKQDTLRVMVVLVLPSVLQLCISYYIAWTRIHA